jgi:cell division septal protein FtsQ
MAEVYRFRRRVLGVLYVTLCVLLVAALFTSPVFGIRHVQVAGITTLPDVEAAAVLRATALPPNTNWLRAPVTTLTNRLRALPFVQSADVSRRLPNRVEARILPRQSRLIVKVGDSHYEVDRFGVPIRAASQEAMQRLPLVVLERPRPVHLGDPFNEDAVTAAIQILQSAQEAFPVRIAKIEVDQTDDMCLNMQDGLPILLGKADALPTKLALVRRIYAREPDVAHRLAAINLTCPTWPACTPRDADPTMLGLPMPFGIL